MPIRFNVKTRRYEQDGTPLPSSLIRERVDALTKKVQSRARRLSAQLNSGDINVDQWHDAMRELLSAAHLAAAAVGKGGMKRLRASDIGRVNRKLEWQFKFLDKFRKAIKIGKFVTNPARIVARSASYASAVYVTFATTKFDEEKAAKTEMQCRLVINSEEGCEECAADADAGWMPVSDMDEIGSRICGDFCRCLIEFEDESL